MKSNKKWFSIVMALWLVIFINLIAINIIDYIIPFSRDTKGIENSVVSYYQANTGIENALYYLKSENFVPWTENYFKTWTIVSTKYWIIASWSLLPPPFSWDSEYDSNWNKIAIWNPIQLEIWWDQVKFDEARFAFRIPDLKNWTNITLDWTTLPVINWQISSDNNTLNAKDSYIISEDVCESNQDFDDCELDLSNFLWIDLNWAENDIETFYSNCSIWKCILKLSIINKLELNDSNNTSVPYLEWQIDFGSNKTPPLRYSIIETEWKAYWYKKDLQIRVPQQTTNEAFDFTVFQ